MTCLFVLIDIRHEPQKVDVEFLTWLGEHQVPFAIVFTKADKLGKVKGEQMVSSYKRFLLKDWEELPPLFVTSAEKGEGRDALIDFISKTNLSIKEAEASGVAPEEAIEEEKRNEISEERMDSSSEEDTTRQIEGEKYESQTDGHR